MTSEMPEELVPHAEFDPSQAVESDRWLAVAHAEIDRIATGVNERPGGPLFNVPAVHAGLDYWLIQPMSERVWVGVSCCVRIGWMLFGRESATVDTLLLRCVISPVWLYGS
jgi:hypothetical protein